jgi:hypothetical protein
LRKENPGAHSIYFKDKETVKELNSYLDVMDSEYIEKNTLPDSHEVSIWLDSYDDIFSDFDPRPYSERSLSDDFIAEAKKVSREKLLKINELNLLIPENKRNAEQESIIIKNLHANFTRHYNYLHHQSVKIKRKGILFILIGIPFMAVASYFSYLNSPLLFINVLRITCEPAGWFFVWTGFDHIFLMANTKEGDINFYSLLAKTHIHFRSI